MKRSNSYSPSTASTSLLSPFYRQISFPVWSQHDVETCSEGITISRRTESQYDLLEQKKDNAIATKGNGGSATLFSCAINLSNTIVGAGMLGLPGAFGGTGYLGGTILLLVGFYFGTQALMLLSRAAVKANAYPSSFYTVAHAAVPRYTMIIDLAVALKCFGVATGYLITVGDCMVEAFDLLLQNNSADSDDYSVASRFLLSQRTWVTFAVLAVLPLSFFRKFDSLKHASATALVFVFFLTAGIVLYAHNLLGDPCEGIGEETTSCRGEVRAVTDIPTTFSKLPIFIFSFTCQQNIFPVVNEIQRRTISRLNIALCCATGFSLLIFYIVAMEGYMTYGSLVKGDLLLNYPENAKVTAMRICIAFMLTMHYPLQLDPSRRCILSLVREAKRRFMPSYSYCLSRGGSVIIQGQEGKQRIDNVNKTTEALKIGIFDPNKANYYSLVDNTDYESIKITVDIKTDDIDIKNDLFGEIKCNDDNIFENKKNDGQEDSFAFYIVTFTFLILSYTLAMIVDDLGVILALVGATGSTLVSYVLPGLIYTRTFKEYHFWRVMAMIQLCLGCCLMPIGLYFVLKGASLH